MITISQSGDISLNLSTCFTTLSTTRSISRSVVNRPIPNLMLECAISSSAPNARRTYEGSNEAEVHAEPDESAISLRAINSDSPSMYANERFTHPLLLK